MKVQLSIVGQYRNDTLVWPEGWPVPRVGEEIQTLEGNFVHVRHVCYYPYSDSDVGDQFVYVVVGEKRYE